MLRDVTSGTGANRPLRFRPSEPVTAPPRRTRLSIPTSLPLDSAAEARFQRLKALRAEISQRNGWPAFVIFHDSVLREIAQLAPSDIASLARIHGVGPKKIVQFGPAILQAIKGDAPNK